MQSFLQKIFLVLFITICHIAKAQTKFSATISPQQIGKNEYAQLRLMVENANQVQQISPPDLKQFNIISGPNQESGMTVINGDVKKYIAVNYVLQPKAVGKIIITAASAKVDGKEFKSNPVAFLVTNATSNANTNSANTSLNPFDDAEPKASFTDYILKKDENPKDKINKNIFIKLDLNKPSCYVGEPIIATYKLYTRLKSESNLTKSPSFNGFSVIDLQQSDNLTYTREKYNGREYNVYIIRKAQLYPLQSGILKLEQAEIENNIQFIKEEYLHKAGVNLMDDVFREFAEASIPPEDMLNEKFVLQSKPDSVNVKPLPDKNVPNSFKGAVGEFSVESFLEKNIFTTNDLGKLKVIIKGQGNLQLVNSPDIQWPQNFEAFEPTITDDFFKTTIPVSGQKNIDYTFTIAVPGNYIIPAIKFSYFNPQEKKYKTDSTKPISFTVKKGIGKKNYPLTVEKKQSESLLNKFFTNRIQVISLVISLIIIGLIIWLKLDEKKERLKPKTEPKTIEIKKEEETNKAKEFNISEKNYLEHASQLLCSDDNAFYTALNLSIKNYLSDKLRLPVEIINKKNIAEQLDKLHIPNKVEIKLLQVMDDIEMKLYMPFTSHNDIASIQKTKQSFYNSASEIMQTINVYIN